MTVHLYIYIQQFHSEFPLHRAIVSLIFLAVFLLGGISFPILLAHKLWCYSLVLFTLTTQTNSTIPDPLLAVIKNQNHPHYYTHISLTLHQYQGQQFPQPTISNLTLNPANGELVGPLAILKVVLWEPREQHSAVFNEDIVTKQGVVVTDSQRLFFTPGT